MRSQERHQKPGESLGVSSPHPPRPPLYMSALIVPTTPRGEGANNNTYSTALAPPPDVDSPRHSLGLVRRVVVSSTIRPATGRRLFSGLPPPRRAIGVINCSSMACMCVCIYVRVYICF
jgi:hypothetical protein